MVKWIAALTVIAAGIGCGGMSTDWEYDNAFDFGALRTYDWIGIRAAPTEMVRRHFEQATDQALAAKGYARSAFNPDFRVVAYFDITRLGATSETGTGLSRGGVLPDSDIPPSWLGESGGTISYAAREGSVMLDMVEPRTKQLLWRGCVSDAFSARMKDEDRVAAVRDAVAALLSRFPPK